MVNFERRLAVVLSGDNYNSLLSKDLTLLRGFFFFFRLKQLASSSHVMQISQGRKAVFAKLDVSEQ